MNPDYLGEFINALLPAYAVPFGPGEAAQPPYAGIGGPGPMTRAPVADPLSAASAATPMDRAETSQPSPAVIMPAVLDALRRQQLHQQGYNKFADQHQLDEQQRFRYAPQYGAQDPFPIGQEFSSRPPMQDFTHAVPSGSLGALSQLIAGLGGVMGSQAPVQRDPQTLSMSSMPSVDPTKSVLRSNMTGIDPLVSEVTRNPNKSTQLQAGGSKIGVIKGQEQQYADNKKRVAGNDQAKTDLLAQRGIARGDAANMRSMGLDPRTAALLTAIKGMTGDSGDMANAFVTGGALGGPQAGMGFVNEQGQRQNSRATTDAFREANAAKNPQAATSPQQAAEVEKKGGAIAAARAAGANPQAVKQAITDTAAELIAKYRKESPEQAEGLAVGELVKKHGVSEKEAKDAVAQVSGKAPESIGNIPNAYATPFMPMFGTPKSIPDALGKWMSKWFEEPTGSWGG